MAGPGRAAGRAAAEPGALGLAAHDRTPLVARALAGQPDTVTRGGLWALSDALTARLRADGFRRVLVRSDDPTHILRAIEGCHAVGADLWIAHTNLPDPFIEEFTRRFGIELVVGDSDRPTGVTPVAGGPARRIHMMTSGTTGEPKVAIHTLESLLSRVRSGARVSVNRAGKWLLTYQPTGFAGLQVALTAVLSHGLLVIPEERTPLGFYQAAVDHGVTQVSATATFWRSLLMVAKPGALGLRQITLGGEAVDQATLTRLRTAFPDTRITHIYASTEAGVVFAVHDGREGFPAAWLQGPVQGVELRIRDGFLHIKTPNAMRAYATEAEQPLGEDGWLKTADQCEVRDDRVYILGRQDSTINVAGSKVYPLSVERFLLGLSGVLEARVFGVPNPVAGAIVGAEVVLAEGLDPKATRMEILKACREQLPGYQVPRAFKIVDAIQVKASGKKG
ncbi:MAG: fatty acid--CoA ligase family protein [Myxococcales bacterium]|nr:fatty acid--CoA ligase family protein [Myxococcales bacterium]